MFRKFYLYIALAAIAAGFVAVCALLFIFRGNAVLLRRKLKLGGIIIALTGMLSSCVPGFPPVVMCYEPAYDPEDWVYLHYEEEAIEEDNPNGTITITLPAQAVMSGELHALTSTVFSWRLRSNDSEADIRGDIAADDGEIQYGRELFKIAIDPALSAGKYTLSFFNTPQDEQDDDGTTPFCSYALAIQRSNPVQQ